MQRGDQDVTGKDLKPEVIDSAWKNLEFTNDPIASSLQTRGRQRRRGQAARQQRRQGDLRPELLNEVLKAKGEAGR